VSDFRKLQVWCKAHALALKVHRVAGGIRGSRNASLRNQMVRAAMSIPANIVEGSGQESRREFGRFLRYAANSATELEYHLIIARDIRAISLTDFAALASQTVEVRKMLRGLIKTVTASESMNRLNCERS
jgi:four helix bundle protein